MFHFNKHLFSFNLIDKNCNMETGLYTTHYDKKIDKVVIEHNVLLFNIKDFRFTVKSQFISTLIAS